MYLVRLNEYSYTIRERDEDDNWDTGDYGLHVTLSALYREPAPAAGMDIQKLSDDLYGYDDIPRGQSAHIVLVEYTDGDTFGSNGYWTIPAIKSDLQDAEDARNRCEAPDDKRWRSWDGYFAGLNGTSVLSFVVL